MTLGLALTSSISSLRVSQEALSLISNNIANAGTEGFNRIQIKQTTEILNGVSAGARIDGVERAIDNFLVTSARRQISEVGRAEALETFFDRTQLFLGQPGADNSINTFVDDFFSSLSALANNPEQVFQRNNALESAISLSDKISGLARDIEQIRFDADQEIATSVAELNGLLVSLNNINVAIKESSLKGGNTNPLLDQRDILLSQISEIVDVSVNFASEGEVTLFVPKGELLTPTQKFEIVYPSAPSIDSLINGNPLDAIRIVLLDNNGNQTTSSVDLVSATDDPIQENNISSGKLKGLLDIRDVELPRILNQLDELSQTLKDTFNAIHNDGVGFPPPQSLTGTNAVDLAQENVFSGQVRIALLDQDGTPVPNSYGTGNLNPLTLDLSRLDSGNGAGVASVQDIIDEINQYYGSPPAQKVSLGPLDDIRAAAVSSTITSVAATGTIQFSGNPVAGVDSITIAGTAFNFIAGATSGTDIQVQATLEDTLTEITNHLSSISTPPVNNATYTNNGANILTITHVTSGDSGNAFTIAAAGGAGTPSGGTLAGGTDVSGTFEFDFEFTNIEGSDATFEVLNLGDAPPGVVTANNGVAFSTPAVFTDFTAPSGVRIRTGGEGVADDTITVDFAGANLEEGDTFTVSVPIRVTDGDGNVFIDTVDYQFTIPDPNDNIKNNRTNVVAISGAGDATLTAPTSNAGFATARLVDANGNVITQPGTSGVIEIVTNQGSYGIAIDELDSQELGLFGAQSSATNRGFSHFFGLNDFFESGATLKNSAVNLDVRDDYKNDSSRLATGELGISNQPADPSANPIFTYEIGVGSNQLIARLADLANSRVGFDAAGGLPVISTTIAGYTTEILGFASLKTSSAKESVRQENLLFDGFNERIESTSGVNIDEELANTVIFQNNFAASARMVNIISDLFDTLINAF